MPTPMPNFVPPVAGSGHHIASQTSYDEQNEEDARAMYSEVAVDVLQDQRERAARPSSSCAARRPRRTAGRPRTPCSTRRGSSSR